jgi:hypothetical protein
MPHVVFSKRINLEEFYNKYQPIIQKCPYIIKIQDIYLNKNKSTVLINALVIDSIHQDFMMELIAREDKSTLRLWPNTDPQKTDGVKTAMGLVTQLILNMSSSDLRINNTNIGEFLQRRIIDR